MRERGSVHQLFRLTAVFVPLSAMGCSVPTDAPWLAVSSQRDAGAAPRCLTSLAFPYVETVAVYDDGSALMARGPMALLPRNPKNETPAVVDRIDAHGANRWRWSPATDEAFVFTDAAVDASGNAIVVGLRGGGHGDLWQSRALLVRLDPAGHELPLARFEERREIHQVVPLRSGDLVYLAERWSLVKVDATGHELWRHALDPQAVSPRAIAIDAADNVIVAGYLTSATDFGGGTLIPTPGVEAHDAFLVEYDAAGRYGWSRRFGDGHQGFRRVATDPEGNIVVLGTNDGTVDLGGGPITHTGALLASFDRHGTYRWSVAPPTNEHYSAEVLGVDGSGAITMGGTFHGTLDLGAGPMVSAGGEDLFLARFDAAGHLQASWPFGGPGNEGLSQVSVSPRGFAALSGGFTAPFDFGCGALPAPRSGWSQFVAVLAPWSEAESSVPPRP